jgi:hypothetical protein
MAIIGKHPLGVLFSFCRYRSFRRPTDEAFVLGGLMTGAAAGPDA